MAEFDPNKDYYHGVEEMPTDPLIEPSHAADHLTEEQLMYLARMVLPRKDDVMPALAELLGEDSQEYRQMTCVFKPDAVDGVSSFAHYLDFLRVFGDIFAELPPLYKDL